MAKWTSGRSERTLNQSAANGRKEPIVPHAARTANYWFELDTHLIQYPLPPILKVTKYF
jgi:hypothetical protein